ncbi:MAG TPA: diguanylate cyclase [Rhizomicrobium sp.]|jgi:GGDEF domain-containing protein|nr:diguanylate cyclase [Rhizomicrobium sp.]
MTSASNSTPSRGQIDHLLAILGLLADGISATGNAAELLDRIRSLAEPGHELPDALVLAEWRQELSGVIDGLNAARELRRQRALAAVSAARVDKVSGLPGATVAQAEIEKAAGLERPPLLALLVFEQLRALNARFNSTIGDQVMAFAAGELARLLADAGALFRWNGPAFLLVSSFDHTKREALERKLNDLAISRIVTTVGLEDRSIHVKVTFSWHVQVIASAERADRISRDLDEVVASRISGK